jgi:hypothetical protein
MRCPKQMLMLACVALSLNRCATLPIDSYCQVYQPVVVAKGDGNIVASSGVKRRMLANELTFRDQCKGS